MECGGGGGGEPANNNGEMGTKGNNAACENKRVLNGMPVDQIAETGR